MANLMPRTSTRALIFAVVLTGAVVRLYGLGRTSFDTEEVIQIGASDGTWPPASQPSISVRPQQAINRVPPVWSVATRVALRWGYAEAIVRLPSAIAGVATLVAVGMLGPQLVGGRVARVRAAPRRDLASRRI